MHWIFSGSQLFHICSLLLTRCGADEATLKKLHAAYDINGEECAAKEKLPNAIGFGFGRGKKDDEWTNKGNGLTFPDYL